MKIAMTAAPLAAALLAQLAPDEAADVARIGSREDTFTLAYADGEKLAGYAVFSVDPQEYLVVYMARSLLPGIGRVIANSILGAASITGKPARVHAEKLRTMARFLGLDTSALQTATDGEGKPMAVYHG